MATLSFAEKYADRHDAAIMLYRGIDTKGVNFFAYLDCTPAGIAKLHRDGHMAGAYELAEYGDVIYLDFLAEPDAKAKAFLKRYITETGNEELS